MLKTFYKKSKHLISRLSAKYMQKIAGKDRAMNNAIKIIHVAKIQ